MKPIIYILLFCAIFQVSGQEMDHIQTIKNNLEVLALENSGLDENLKLDFNVTNVTLSNFLVAVSKVHNLNISLAPNLNNVTIVNNFSEVNVADLLVFLCKEYGLTIDFTGNILSIKPYEPPPVEVKEKEIGVSYTNSGNLISLDLKNDPLGKVFRTIMDVSGKNLLYGSGMENKPLNLYLSKVPFDLAMEKLAETNGMTHTQSKDGFYLFDAFADAAGNSESGHRRLGRGQRPYQILDTVNRLLDVHLINTPIASLIYDLGHDLDLDIYTAGPLEEAGNVTFTARDIYFDDLLRHIFESQETHIPVAQTQNRPNTTNARQNRQNTPPPAEPLNFTFKKEGNIYFFGTADQLSLREVEIVQMMYRSVELLGDPTQSSGYRSSGRTASSNISFFGTGGAQNNPSGLNSGNNLRNVNTRSRNFDTYQDGAEAIVSILPDELKADLDIRVDYELNSFFVSGPASNIERFKKFIKEIDRPVPVVLIEVMIIEVRKSANVETGISWGIGDAPVTTQGKLFPETDATLGAQTVNKIIGGFDGFGSFNIGQVVPEFFANIKAMEENGNLKIRSTPKLSTLNGHRAHLSIGETTYYVVTNQNFFGSQIPTTSEVRNYHPIDAELAISIKPLVSGNGQVTLDINVIQSDFSGERIEEDAPPGLTSREFSSIVRMQNQDLAILGGLEEKLKNDAGNGVPLLARVPVIKWLFSQRRREDTKQKLTILIKPTVIY